MTIRTSIYDFFAYAIPGGLFLFNILIFLKLFDVTIFNKTIYIPSELIIFAVFLIMSYIFGHLTSVIYSQWTKIFESRAIPKLAMTEFKKKHPNLKIEIDSNDWQIWFASIKRENDELKLEVDRMMATSYFLRGVSLNLVILVLVVIIGVIKAKLLSSTLVGTPFLLLFSFISVRESIKFNKWFYFSIYEIVISRQLPYRLNDSMDKPKGKKFAIDE